MLEVIDAYQMPEKAGLQKAAHEINHVTSDAEIVAIGTTVGNWDWVEEKERNHVQYGANLNGVGISGFDICSSSSFRNLQSETEDKVKFYVRVIMLE